MSNAAALSHPSRLPWWAALLVLPIAGLGLLLARPELDITWEHHPSHFWLVLLTAVVNVVLAYVTNVAAGRYRDARLVLVSLAFLASAGFLGLHALATPGVLLPKANTGFVVATPVGLVLASLFAAISVSSIAGPHAATALRRRSTLLGGVLLVMAAWAFLSLTDLPPFDGPPPAQEGVGLLTVLAVVGVGLYAYSAWRYVQLFRNRGGVLPITVAIAFVLLAEALVAVALSRNWHASWWEWHVLMLLAFAAIALGARREYGRSGSLTAAFGGLYLEATLARVDRWHAGAIAAVAGPTSAGSRRSASSRNCVATGPPAMRLPWWSGRPANCAVSMPCSARTCPRWSRSGSAVNPARPGSAGRSATSACCSPISPGSRRSARRGRPTEVITMLNEYWAVVVPVIDAAGGVIEHFAGDGIMAIFNAAGDQPDHAQRAARAALAIIGAGRPLAERTPAGRSSGSGSTPARRSSATLASPDGTASRSSATRPMSQHG